MYRFLRLNKQMVVNHTKQRAVRVGTHLSVLLNHSITFLSRKVVLCGYFIAALCRINNNNIKLVPFFMSHAVKGGTLHNKQRKTVDILYS